MALAHKMKTVVYNLQEGSCFLVSAMVLGTNQYPWHGEQLRGTRERWCPLPLALSGPCLAYTSSYQLMVSSAPYLPILQNCQPLYTNLESFPVWHFVDKALHLQGRVWKTGSRALLFHVNWNVKWVPLSFLPLFTGHISLSLVLMEEIIAEWFQMVGLSLCSVTWPPQMHTSFLPLEPH